MGNKNESTVLELMEPDADFNQDFRNIKDWEGVGGVMKKEDGGLKGG